MFWWTYTRPIFGATGKKCFGGHTHVLFLGPLVPQFWISFDVSSGFQSQSGFCLIHIVQVNIMYIPWDPPVALHVYTLLTVSIVGQQMYILPFWQIFDEKDTMLCKWLPSNSLSGEAISKNQNCHFQICTTDFWKLKWLSFSLDLNESIELGKYQCFFLLISQMLFKEPYSLYVSMMLYTVTTIRT